MTFGEKLQALRKAKGISQEQLASQMSVSRQAVSKWELGESNPDIENIVQLSQFFEVTTDYLLTENGSSASCGQSAEKNGNAVTGRILYIASAAFMAIGLLCAFGGWYEEQSMENIWGGMIIQVVGIVGYFIGKQLAKEPPAPGILFANWALGLFMPVSMLACLLCRRTVSPYPIDLDAIAVFCLLYFVGLAGFVFFRKRRRSAQ